MASQGSEQEQAAPPARHNINRRGPRAKASEPAARRRIKAPTVKAVRPQPTAVALTSAARGEAEGTVQVIGRYRRPFAPRREVLRRGPRAKRARPRPELHSGIRQSGCAQRRTGIERDSRAHQSDGGRRIDHHLDRRSRHSAVIGLRLAVGCVNPTVRDFVVNTETAPALAGDTRAQPPATAAAPRAAQRAPARARQRRERLRQPGSRWQQPRHPPSPPRRGAPPPHPKHRSPRLAGKIPRRRLRSSPAIRFQWRDPSSLQWRALPQRALRRRRHRCLSRLRRRRNASPNCARAVMITQRTCSPWKIACRSCKSRPSC